MALYGLLGPTMAACAIRAGAPFRRSVSAPERLLACTRVESVDITYTLYYLL